LAVSNKFSPKQITQLTQHNPAVQSQVIKFFDANPEERQFLEHRAAAAAALENKMGAEQRTMLESKHDAEHPRAVPKQALAVRDNQAHQASVTFAGNHNVGTLVVLVEGTVSLVAANIKAEHVLLASLFDDVCLKAIVERFGNSENFHDVLQRANIVAEGIIQILAGKDVIFEAAHTQSGLGTRIEALGNILDMPVQLVRQQVQHFYERKRSGTRTNKNTTDVPSIHQSGANVDMGAGDSATLRGTKIKAKNVTVAAVGNTNILPVANCYEQTCDMTREKGGFFGSGGKKTEQSVSMQQTAVLPEFDVQENVTIVSGQKLEACMNSSALENHFWGEVVHLTQGVNQSCSATQTSSQGMLWKKLCLEATRAVTYAESNFSGSIEIHAKQALFDQVRGKTLGFWGQVQCNDAAVTYQILDPQYQHDTKKVQGPSQGLVIVVSLAAGVATFGMGTAVAESAFVTGIVGTGATMGTAVAAGFSALCGQAAVSLLQNEGNPLKAVKSLASEETAKSVAMAMISAGVMKEICGALKLPGLGEGKSLVEHLQYNVARASVNAALNMSINHQSPGDAVKAGLMDAAVGTAAGAVAQKIGELRKDGHVNYVGHKLLHAALGAVGGAILGGTEGAFAGAVAAPIAEGVAEACAPDATNINSKEDQKHYEEELSRAAQIGTAVGATAALLARQNVPIAANLGGNATTNNFLTSNGLSRRSAVGGSDADAREPKDEPKDEVDDSELMRELARERTARSMTFKLGSRGDSRMPRNGWERLAEDRASVMYVNDTTRDFGRKTQGHTLKTNTHLLDTQPVLLWSAPNHPNRTAGLHMGTLSALGLTPSQIRRREDYPVIASLFDGVSQGEQELNSFFHSVNQRFPILPGTPNQFSAALLFSGPVVAMGRTVVIPKVVDGVQWLYRGYVARQAAQQAFSGGKYAGQAKTFGKGFPDRELPRCLKTREPIPDPEFKNTWHSQLGTRQGSSGKYPKAREFGPDNKVIREIEFTNHGRSDHPNPHQHRYIPNKTGGTAERGPEEPLNNSLNNMPESVQKLLSKSVLNSFKPGGKKK